MCYNKFNKKGKQDCSMKKFIVIAIILALLGFGGYKVYKYIDDEAKAWKVEVIVDTLNIRDDSKRETNKIK